MLKNLRVKAMHNNMEFKIIGLSDLPCYKQTYGSIPALYLTNGFLSILDLLSVFYYTVVYPYFHVWFAQPAFIFPPSYTNILL